MFELGQKAVIFQRLQCAFAKMTNGDPGDCLDIPEGTRGVFDVGFEVVVGAIVFVVAGIEFFRFGFEKAAAAIGPQG